LTYCGPEKFEIGQTGSLIAEQTIETGISFFENFLDFRLKIQNGNSDGTNKVTKIEIRINDVIVFKSTNFSKDMV
jgi:hypothetical protein